MLESESKLKSLWSKTISWEGGVSGIWKSVEKEVHSGRACSKLSIEASNGIKCLMSSSNLLLE
jgi:hypothetical protein